MRRGKKEQSFLLEFRKKDIFDKRTVVPAKSAGGAVIGAVRGAVQSAKPRVKTCSAIRRGGAKCEQLARGSERAAQCMGGVRGAVLYEARYRALSQE